MNWGRRPTVYHHVGGRGGTTTLNLKKARTFLYDADPQANGLHYCLGAKHGNGVLKITANKYGSSLFWPDPSFFAYHCAEATDTYGQMLRVIETLPVEIWTLDEVIAREKLPAPEVLSIDTQGSELDILKGARKALSTVNTLAVEVEFVPIYVDQPMFQDIFSWLWTAGFEFRKLLTAYYVKREGEVAVLGFGDALFERRK